MSLCIEAKKNSVRTKIWQDKDHFYLDNQQQQNALIAKKQLDECSNEFDEHFESQVAINRRKMKKYGWEFINEQRTCTTNIEFRSCRRKDSHQGKNYKISCKRLSQCRGPENKEISEREQKKDMLHWRTNSGKIQNILFDAQLESSKIWKHAKLHNQKYYKQRIQNFFKKTNIKSKTQQSKTLTANNGLTNITPIKKKSLQISRGLKLSQASSNTKKSEQKKNYHQQKYPSSTNKSNKYENYKQRIKTVQNDENQKNILNNQQKQLSRMTPSKINLRPQFMRLIQKIKQKQQKASFLKHFQIKNKKTKN